MDLVVRIMQPNPDTGLMDTCVERYEDCAAYAFDGDEHVLKVIHKHGITKYPTERVVRTLEVHS